MTSSRPRPAAPPSRRAWRRTAVVLTVLAGLFLMHGMSATSGGGCHGATMSGPSATDAALPPAMAMPGPAGAAVGTTTAVTAHTADGSSLSGDSCIPLRPDEPAGLLLVLAFAGIWLAWRPSDIGIRAAALRREWAHGPPRPGAALLRELSVCRT